MPILSKFLIHLAITVAVRVVLAFIEIWQGIDVGKSLAQLIWDQPTEKWIQTANWGIALLVALILFQVGWRLHKRQNNAKVNSQESERTDDLSERDQLVPDWKIADAMDYIAAIYGNANEEHLGTKYTEPTQLLTSKARSGEIQVWGRRIFDDDNAELSQRPMKPSDWEDIELSIWACTTSAGHSHTESASQQEVQQFTDLHVSESQIKGIQWLVNTATKYNQGNGNNWVPLREAFNQITKHLGYHGITEADQEQMYSEAARRIRQAAKTDGLKLRGNEHAEHWLSEYPYTDVKPLIPENYWDHMKINWRGVIIDQPDTGHTSLDDALIYEGDIKALPQYYNVDIWHKDLNYHWPIKG